MCTPIKIKTHRFVLEELEESHFSSIQVYASDREVVHFMEWGPNTEKETWSFLESAILSQSKRPRVDYQLAIIGQDQLLGSCRICITSPSVEGFIGYCLRRESWGVGYGTEAAEALLLFGFRELRLHRISATCDTENRASLKILEKIGMKREGRLREHKRIRGEWRDSYLYAILEEEYTIKRETSL